jgi:NADP-dependent 3-hydroxy acid dehydrogenase YdfG
MASLKDKVVIVTGASSGIGYETALAFAREGAKTVLAAPDEEPLRELAGRIEALGGEALVVPTDVRDRDQVERMVQSAVDRFGRVDVIVNNAGYGLGATIEQTTEQDFRDLWETNVLGVLYGMQAVLPVMRRQGSGHVISVSSAAGRIPFPGIGAYSATKAAVFALTEALRVEEEDAGIRASVVFPIGTRTRFFKDARLIDSTSSVGPHGPTQAPEHVARRIVACARRPTEEVVPYRPLRLGMVLKALFPPLYTFIGRRAYREQLKLARAREGAVSQAEREAPHG